MKIIIVLLILMATALIAVALFFALNTLNLSRSIRVGVKYRRIKDIAVYVERKVDQSNVQSYIPFYNLTMHVILSFITAAIVYGLAVKEFEKMSILICVAAVGFLIPTMAIQLLADYMGYAIRKGSVDMVVALSSAYATETDIFKAFGSIAEYAIAPLKSRIQIMLGEYALKVSPVKCLTRFRASINSSDLQSLIAQMTIKYVEGGNLTPLFQRYMVHVKKISEDEENGRVEDLMTNLTLYVGILCNFAGLHTIMQSSYRNQILDTMWGQASLMVNLIMVVVVIVLSLKRH